MLGLSRVVFTLIQNLRIDEIRTSKAYRKIFVLVLLLCMLNATPEIYIQVPLTILPANTPINLAPVVTFAIYVIISVFWKHESLLTAQAFTSLALISLLTTPVIVFIQALPRVIECTNCFCRIQEYCNYGLKSEALSEIYDLQDVAGGTVILQHSTPNEVESAQSSPENLAISFKGQSFGWKENEPSILRDLHIAIKRRSITAIVGQVGSGKSTLLQSILGETIASLAERQKATTSVAYCSQEPWLENTTIRQNIIGISAYEPKWYSLVISCCCLDPDLRQLQEGDQTCVGSKALNLSGGQKQRIVCSIVGLRGFPAILTYRYRR
jgi:ATP-binding cassette, subfamily C (CFTR/MRP), member 1